MTISARDHILQRLRAAAKETGSSHEPDFSVIRDRHWSVEEKVERLTHNLEAVNGEVHRVASGQLAHAVTQRLEQAKARNILLGSNSPHAEDLGPALPGHIDLLTYSRAIEDWKQELFEEVDAALTTTRGAVAETGSLILWPTPAEPRLMSLVPPLHLAVVSVSQLYSTFWQAMIEQQWVFGMPTNALLVSGPSKTADIEQTLVYGAHGPRELVVYLIE